MGRESFFHVEQSEATNAIPVRKGLPAKKGGIVARSLVKTSRSRGVSVCSRVEAHRSGGCNGRENQRGSAQSGMAGVATVEAQWAEKTGSIAKKILTSMGGDTADRMHWAVAAVFVRIIGQEKI